MISFSRASFRNAPLPPLNPVPQKRILNWDCLFEEQIPLLLFNDPICKEVGFLGTVLEGLRGGDLDLFQLVTLTYKQLPNRIYKGNYRKIPASKCKDICIDNF